MLPLFEVPDAVLRGLIVLLALGFVPALIFAWAFEMTPDGLRRETEVEVAPEVKQRTASKLNWATMVVAMLAIGLLLVDRLIPEPGASSVSTPLGVASSSDAGAALDRPPARSIAVLAFDDLSLGGDQEYFADGMAEEILNLLARLPDLKVAGRTSAFQFKGRHQDLRRIGELLGVEALLEGSVRKAGNRLRITAQLISTADGFHLWSETYDRELTDVFAIQDDIASAIADALQVELLGVVADRSRPTENLEAYQLYLQGRHLILQRGVANLHAAVERLERAVTLDPQLAPAWADLAVGLMLIPAYEWTVKRAPYARRALEAADHALALDPGLAMAHVARSFLFLNNREWALSLSEAERAIALEPQNETAWFYHAMAFHRVGDIESALVSAERAYAISPATGVNAGWLGALLFGTGDHARAERYVDESISLGWVFAGLPKARLQIEARNFEAARASLRNFLRIAGEPEDALDLVVDALQDPMLLTQAIADLAKQRAAGGHYSVWAGGILLGDSEGLAGWLEKSSTNLAPSLSWVYSLSGGSTVDKPAFKAFLRRIGLVDYWQANGWRSICRPRGVDDFECS